MLRLELNLFVLDNFTETLLSFHFLIALLFLGAGSIRRNERAEMLKAREPNCFQDRLSK